MDKPKTITQMSKEQLEDMCINLMSLNHEQVHRANKLEDKIEQLERQIRIKDKWCQLIIDIGFDYDGCNKVESLKKIIDELVEYSRRAIKNDDKTVAYVGGGDGKKLNILSEEIKEE